MQRILRGQSPHPRKCKRWGNYCKVVRSVGLGDIPPAVRNMLLSQ